MTRTIACVSAALMLAFAVSGCGDPAADAKAAADKQAARDKKVAMRKMQGGVGGAIECINAIEWQKGPLAAAGIGPVSVYTDYHMERLKAALGTDTITLPPAPALSAATIPDYLRYSYPLQVKDKFTAGVDSDGDGTISPKERSNPGFGTVLSCIQFAAEAGKGPLAGNDKVARMFKMQELRGKLKDKDA